VADLRNRQFFGALLIVLLTVPLSYLIGGRNLQRQAQQLRDNAGQLARQGDELSRLAFQDPLTGLANRSLLNDRLEHALSVRRRPVDVLLLDLDEFKTVNDVLGHAAGDALLVEVAQRLRDCAGPAATVARLGGDEFTIVLEGADDAEAVALALVGALSVPVMLERRQVLPHASIGIARADGAEEVSASELLRRADIAMYAAKTAGKNRCATFWPDMTTALVARADLESALRAAVEQGETVVHHQPIVDTRSRRVRRVEALVRWQHPSGLVPPGSSCPWPSRAG